MKFPLFAGLVLLGSWATSATATIQNLAAYRTPQGQVVITGLTPNRLHGVIAHTGQGVGVKNFTATPCGEVVIPNAANFQFISIRQKRFTPKSLGVKSYANCTKAPSAR